MRILQAKTILLVEDDPVTSLIGKKTLEKYGFKVVVAVSGEKAVETVETDAGIDLVLMDIDLGKGIDGTEAAKIILKKHDLPLVFHSSHTERGVVEKTEGITSYGYIAKNSGETVLIASIKMAFRLFESRKIYSDTFDYSINGLCIHRMLRDENGKPHDCAYLKVNKAFERHTGLSPEFLQGKTIRAIYPDNQANEVIDLYAGVISTGIPLQKEIYFEPTGHWYDLNIFPMQNDEFTVVVQNITETRKALEALRKAEESLKASREMLLTLINSTPDAIFFKDMEGRYLFVNEAKVKQLGLKSEDEMIGKTVHDFFPKEQADIFTEKEKLSIESGSAPQYWEDKIEIPGRDTVWHYNIKVPFRDKAGMPIGLISISRDITKEKNFEENIKGLLAEKELLLKETHHRVKNNMNIIQGLLTLQAEFGANPAVREKLLDVAVRVRNMTILYDKLYRSETFRELGIKDFLPPLIDEIVGIFPAIPPVRTEVRVEDIILSSKILSPLGIIINELITNSMKYAFKGRDSGVIAVSASQKDGLVTIAYEDDGVGLPESVNFENSGGFGMQLVQMLTEQIGGTVRIERLAGTRVVIEFGV
jgi:PAS domain S-box-containing protein